VRVGELLGSFGGQLLTDRWEVRYITRVCPFGPRIAGTYSTYQANIGKSLFVSPKSCSVFVRETRGMRVPISMPILCVMTPSLPLPCSAEGLWGYQEGQVGQNVPLCGQLGAARSRQGESKGAYGWIPHNAGFGFLDKARAKLGQIHF
jgi:hypothetical protein